MIEHNTSVENLMLKQISQRALRRKDIKAYEAYKK
jgi:hypothetical protein